MGFLAQIGAILTMLLASILGSLGFSNQPTVPVPITLQALATSTPTTASVNSGDVSAYHWIQISSTSTIYYAEDEGIDNPYLIKPVDLATYEIFATSSASTDFCFSKDKNNVYFHIGGGSFGSGTNIANLLDTGADPTTFVGMSDETYYGICYGKDKGDVYVSNGSLDAYAVEGKITGADPITFTTNSTLEPFAKDAFHVYLLDQVVNGADPSTFTAIPGSSYAKDATHVFFQVSPDLTTVIPGADPATFESVNDPTGTIDAQDKNHTYLNGKIVQ